MKLAGNIPGTELRLKANLTKQCAVPSRPKRSGNGEGAGRLEAVLRPGTAVAADRLTGQDPVSDE